MLPTSQLDDIGLQYLFLGNTIKTKKSDMSSTAKYATEVTLASA
jgi:hypothetical protein